MRKYFNSLEILEAVIITDKNTGKSKGYGFVTFRDPESARKACVDPNPVIDGRRANCNIASLGRPRPSPHYSGVAASVPPSPPPPTVFYPPYGYPTYSPEYLYHQGVYNPQIQRHNTIINSMDHHHQWGPHIIMAILCKLQGEHFLHHRLNVSCTFLSLLPYSNGGLLLTYPPPQPFHLTRHPFPFPAPSPSESQTQQHTTTETEAGAVTSESPKI
ncbi:hypothetical protein F3Y22_tig00112254pilonHSYRG00046 [Hibiscus syriacus]|uniref:RRM domain-containing protein n=1 Tax=Hibiscus syriacus TaxID=106335 RepID=A0A6A2X2N7_HIBSY|nr:hypothetical protein F3Y22_tig00112254pilonHSYRG00046 [Hibiscus syriacus]